MNRKNLNIVLTAIIIAAGGCSSGDYFVKKGASFSGYRQVGILVRPTDNLSENQAQSIASDLAAIVLSKRGYSVIEQFHKKELMSEQTLRLAGLYEGDPVEVGKLKSVKALLIITFPKYDLIRNRQEGSGVRVLGSGVSMSGKDLLITDVSVSLRLVSAATGELLYMASASRRLRGERLREASASVIGEALENLPRI
jgi:curli biogenesis system outer membrane secretion channel CsgG